MNIGNTFYGFVIGGCSDGLGKHKPFTSGGACRGLCGYVRDGLSHGGSCVIDAIAIAKIVSVLMACWALGFGIGKSVAWVRHIGNVV